MTTCRALLAALALGAAAPALRAQQISWVRETSPFPVADSAGTPIPTPFLGGLNHPRPQLVDIDGDGDLDLFVQEVTGAVAFYERTARGWEWRSDRYAGLDVGEWFRFADGDGDGDMDLFGESLYSHIRYWRNDGTRTAPHFVVGADTLLAPDGTPVFADRQNILQVLDVDCNGRLDLLVGQVQGTVTRYEATEPMRAGAMPRFTLDTERWQGIEIIAQLGSAHGANTMTFADLDRDGDPDLLWGDFFEPGLLYLENRGTCREPVFGEPQPFPAEAPLKTSGYNAPTTGDVDGDGDLDIVVGVLGGAFNPNISAIANLYLLAQTRPGVFQVQTSRLLPTLDLGNETAVAAGDVDGDGDLDLLVGTRIDPTDVSTGRLYLLEHTGTARAPGFQVRRVPPVQGMYYVAPGLGDLDGDGDLDLLVGNWRDAVQVWRNDGAAGVARWVLGDTALVRITRGSSTAPVLVDLDGDGDLDLVIGEASGTLNFYRNDGSRRAANFVLGSDAWQDIDVGRRAAPAFGDLDNDGDLDLLVGGEDGGIAWRNTGSVTAPHFVRDSALTAALMLPPGATPVIVDLDHDGVVDVVAGSVGGGLLFLRGVRH